MKYFFISAFLFTLLSVTGICQKNAPDNIRKEFTMKFPSAQNVKWTHEDDNEWEAEFKMNGYKMSASYNNSGKWIETETGISSKDLPAAVTAAIKNDFPGFKSGEMSIVEHPELNGYEIALKKGEASYEVIFDKNGTILKKTDLKEGDEHVK